MLRYRYHIRRMEPMVQFCESGEARLVLLFGMLEHAGLEIDWPSGLLMFRS